MSKAWRDKEEIARAVAGGYRDSNGKSIWIQAFVAKAIAERIAAASIAKGKKP